MTIGLKAPKELQSLRRGVFRRSHVGNNPINYVDPDGLTAVAIPGGLPIIIPPGSVFEPGSQQNNTFVHSAEEFLKLFDPRPLADAIGDAVSDLLHSPAQMAKGGIQNKDNEYSRAARLQPDPCEWLKAQYKAASSSVAREKIKTAQKVLGCRKNSTLNDVCKGKDSK